MTKNITANHQKNVKNSDYFFCQESNELFKTFLKDKTEFKDMKEFQKLCLSKTNTLFGSDSHFVHTNFSSNKKPKYL